MTVLAYVRMVLWSFIGIRKRACAGEEFEQVKPVPLVATALVLTAGFGVFLWGLVQLAVSVLQ